jgi:hypothetical protein
MSLMITHTHTTNQPKAKQLPNYFPEHFIYCNLAMIDNEKQELEPFLEKAVRFQEHCEQVSVFRFPFSQSVGRLRASSSCSGSIKVAGTVKPYPIFDFLLPVDFLSRCEGAALFTVSQESRDRRPAFLPTS